MPHFVAKKRCFYDGQMCEKGQVVEFFQPVSAQSWGAMDEEGKTLLVYPEDAKKSPEAVEVFSDEFEVLKVTHEVLFADFESQKERVSIIEQERDIALQSVAELQNENKSLAKAAEDATAQLVSIAELKQMVKDKENKDVLEEAIVKL
ncbi:hypothetical protein [Halodesulfovibrio sp. MK-HDV]|uniref:hypothetical protein n=1 Tax=Halodesulfovibrio sp. MK-HDV TaxID=2599925 RepID=UPI00136B67A2|nr:hypothetical protein [Halodesulfovibrio sp. MK-HDV]KAF1077662.1 hypothetical protein MKHDV_00118 [Halodesulfovibrio sp. MK-HDV]